MQRRNLSILLIAFFAIALTAGLICAQPPEVLWTRTYGGSGNDVCRSMQPTADGCYILAGYTTSFGTGDQDMYLVKIDALGNLQWEQTCGGTDAYSVKPTTDGGYILTGYTGPGPNYGDVYLVKTDAGGGVLWSKTFPAPSETDLGNEVQQTADGGYIIAGGTAMSGLGWRALLIKCDANGDLMWSRTYAKLLQSYEHGNFSCVRQTSDGGYVLLGDAFSGPWDIWLVKTDAVGNILWDQIYGGSPDEATYWNSLDQTSDGGYIIAGYSNGSGSYDVWLIKTDANGNLLWDRLFGGSGYDLPHEVQQTNEGGFIIAGVTRSDFGSADMWLIKTDASGYGEWNQTYGGVGSDEAYCVLQTSDDGYVLSGYTDSFGAGGYDMYVIRLGELPITGIISGAATPTYPNLTVDLFQGTTLVSSVLTEADGSYSFPDLQPGNYTVELVVPLGFTVNMNNVPVTLAAGQTITVNFALTPMVTSDQARGLGYWKHQVDANLTGHGATDYTTTQLLAFAQEIFDHFYSNPVNPIQVSGVTYVGETAHALGMTDLQYMLNINQGGSTKYQRACQHYLTLFLNVVSNKLGQYAPASYDNPPRTVSQAMVYINQLLIPNPPNAASNETAKNIAETLNEAQKVAANLIPLSTPNVIFSIGEEQMTVEINTYKLNEPSPNPFNASTTITFQLPQAGHINLRVFDTAGRLVTTLIDSRRDAGTHQTTFDGSKLASGVYLYVLTAGEYHAAGKMVLMK